MKMSEPERRLTRLLSKTKDWECPYCGKNLPEEFKSLQCDTYDNWVCLPCTSIPDDMYKIMTRMNDPKNPSLGTKGIKWVCRLCDKSLPVLKEMNTTLGTLMKTNNERFDAIKTQVNKLENSIGDKVSEEVTNLKEKLTEVFRQR